MSTSILLWVVIGYLSGSVSYARIAGRLAGVDIVGHSSDGNPGGANVFMMVGKTAGVLVIILDIAKGAVPVWIFNRLYGFYDPWSALVISAPVVGHAWPVFDPFHGGKAISTSFGCLLGLVPVWQPLVTLIVIYVFFSAVILINPHVMRSIITYLIFGFCQFFWNLDPVILGGCLLMALIIILRHLPSCTMDAVSFRFIGEKNRTGAGESKKAEKN
ncbi:MAG: glycerol-3-phosphate acyltransferase [Eubacteriaceae bacterium]|jgi:glycerol-3-phosphate acyltransferase PlsY